MAEEPASVYNRIVLNYQNETDPAAEVTDPRRPSGPASDISVTRGQSSPAKRVSGIGKADGRFGLAGPGIHGHPQQLAPAMSAEDFWSAFERVYPRQAGGPGRGKALAAARLESPIGALLAIADDSGVYSLEFISESDVSGQLTRIRKRVGSRAERGSCANLDKTREALRHYFAGTRMEFTVPFVLNGSDFECSVWDLLLQIPPGQTRSYRDLAMAMGRPAAVRAVGRANGSNNLCLIVPCHRVIGASGSLVGYGGGLWRKKWLLEHEMRFAASSNPLLPF